MCQIFFAFSYGYLIVLGLDVFFMTRLIVRYKAKQCIEHGAIDEKMRTVVFEAETLEDLDDKGIQDTEVRANLAERGTKLHNMIIYYYVMLLLLIPVLLYSIYEYGIMECKDKDK